MKYSARAISVYLLGFFIVLFAYGGSEAASLVKADGMAIITSQIDKKEYRKLAIEDALQNISTNQNIRLNSFSLVENGKILVDQIQSSSSIEILSFEVIDEKIKTNIFHVTIEALIQDKKNSSNDAKPSTQCRKTEVKEIDLITKIRLDEQKFPVWLDFNSRWLQDKLTKINSLNGINVKFPQNKSSKGANLYTLYKQQEALEKPNLYKIELSLSFEKKVERSLISKISLMYLQISTRIVRDEKILNTYNNEFEFGIYNSVADLTLLSSKRQNWKVQREIVLEKIQSELRKHVYALQCISINPKIVLTNNDLSLEYGSLDGLTINDMFEVESDNGDKIFLKVPKIGPDKTILEAISQRANLSLLQGKTAKLLSKNQ